jgi:3'(2'), 5'-bisphosphate nucleotidase
MHERELKISLDAARGASLHLIQVYEYFQAIPDAPADISTDADRQSQEIILQTILRAFPHDALCAEEATSTLRESVHTGERVWIVDPIDGTRGFARKNGEFSVMIGFVERGQIQVGVVAQPAVRKLTYAQRGEGCWRLDGDDTQPTRCLVLALEPERIIESYSAGIKLALVARGDADVYLNTYEAFHDWDICAGHVLVTEAGGMVTGTGGQELHYGLPGAWQKNGLLATNGLLHQAALEIIAT